MHQVVLGKGVQAVCRSSQALRGGKEAVVGRVVRKDSKYIVELCHIIVLVCTSGQTLPPCESKAFADSA